MEMENMTRGHGWRFLDFGRRLERAYNLVDVIRATLATAEVDRVLPSLLEIADSTITYRRRYFSEPRLPAVLDLLLVDAGNPRALAFQLNALRDHARALPKSPESASFEILLERVNALNSQMGEFLPADLEAGGQTEKLKGLLTSIASELTALSDDVTEQYFCHTISQRVEGEA
jgi:uncharacterized alpha-E superfamily protein